MGSFKLYNYYFKKSNLSICPDMKFSAVLLVLACAYSAHGDAKIKCLIGTAASVTASTAATECASADDKKCKGPVFDKTNGYKDAKTAFACGECKEDDEKCVDGKDIKYEQFKNTCVKYKFDKTWMISKEKKNDKEVDVLEVCTPSDTADAVRCIRPNKDAKTKVYKSFCGKCDDDKVCTDCAGEKCNSAGALIAPLVPLLALLYTLL